MTPLTRPRGPLPPRVYWTRRALVLATALALVFGIGQLLTRSSDGSDRPTATTVAATTSPTSSATEQAEKKDKKKRKNKKKPTASASPTPPPLPTPTGPCSPSDVVVTGSVPDPVGGAEILVNLDLQTRTTPACTWTASPDTLNLKITSGRDEIWTSRECPTAIPVQDLVLYRDQPTTLGVTWSARRSDATCSDRTDWALPGYYHVITSAYSGEPVDVQFLLTAPPRPTVTQTVTPSPTNSPTKSPRASQAPTEGPTSTNGGAPEPSPTS